MLWSQAALLFRAQYDVQDSGTDVAFGTTSSQYFDQETLALDDIARGAASALVNSLLEGF